MPDQISRKGGGARSPVLPEGSRNLAVTDFPGGERGGKDHFERALFVFAQELTGSCRAEAELEDESHGKPHCNWNYRLE